ncbi:MAG: DsbA family protein [Haloferacaceae archaeon]
MRLSRRRALAAGGTALVAGLAGCSGSGGGGADTGGQTSSGDPTLDDHPVGRDIGVQPRLGPPPGEATGTIVAFEDPSCPRCAAFERQTVPKIRSNLVDPGDATFVFRGVPIVYPWGDPAARALEATYAESSDAFWALADHYFENQSAFRGQGTDAVLSMTASFLDDETGLDGASVAEAVRAGEADAAVEADLSASEDANVDSTPTVFLFRDGTVRTRARGSVSYDVVAGALGL